MPSFRQKVSTYFRQLSFVSERDHRNRIQQSSPLPNGSFITQYLEGVWEPPDSTPIIHNGKSPEDMPEVRIGRYVVNQSQADAAYTGPFEGLTGIRRTRTHLTAGIADDIDFIDVPPDSGLIVQKESNLNSNPANTTYQKHSESSNSTCSPQLEQITKPTKNGTVKELDQKTNHDNEPIACIADWNRPNEDAYGISVSLYEKHFHSSGSVGDPIADCFGIVTRPDSCIMAMADGVNWGEGARIAARSAVQGSMEYLNSAVFGIHQVTSTKEIFVSLVRSFWEAHKYILQVGGALSTLTIAIVLPAEDSNQSIVCCCNVGDSLGYVFSKNKIVRELTQASHDVNLMRDMRDALGALGPVHGDKPEMSNLTLSMSYVDEGDIVFLTSDGISDNFDPVVGRFAEAVSSDGGNTNTSTTTNVKQQSSIHAREPTYGDRNGLKPVLAHKRHNKSAPMLAHSTANHPERKVPVTLRQPSQQGVVDRSYSSKYVARSKTFIEPSGANRQPNNMGNRSGKAIGSGMILPRVTAAQRHTLTLLRIADLLVYGINGSLRPCTTAKQLCQLLIDFVSCITAAKRKLLEQRELYYKVVTAADGTCKETRNTRQEHKVIRKRMVDGTTFSVLPGKLDHASIVAYTVRRRCMEKHIV
ncbi:PP2C-like domain-containing protein CG9801 isoform X1 [Anopheles cruzii]|uniref:PP2C-like domain-containing protein CG9801 isoform X1 n=1 Tax=Anopheles cruzii TaxID=68878 RepID=UPI0022EC7BF9|nr:PP2C-like domain-containing protein CG9801 isoform X1 [Anopheles cruzii]